MKKFRLESVGTSTSAEKVSDIENVEQGTVSVVCASDRADSRG